MVIKNSSKQNQLHLKKIQKMNNIKRITKQIYFLAGYFLIINYSVIYSQNDVQKKLNADIYMTPSNPHYGFGDKGIYRFNLKAKSIVVPISKSSYWKTIQKKDSVYELFYTNCFFDTILLDSIVFDSTLLFDNVRILIILNNNDIVDSLEIDCDFNLKIKNKTYKTKKDFQLFLLQKMPEEIYEQWVYLKGRLPIQKKEDE